MRREYPPFIWRLKENHQKYFKNNPRSHRFRWALRKTQVSWSKIINQSYQPTLKEFQKIGHIPILKKHVLVTILANLEQYRNSFWRDSCIATVTHMLRL